MPVNVHQCSMEKIILLLGDSTLITPPAEAIVANGGGSLVGIQKVAPVENMINASKL